MAAHHNEIDCAACGSPDIVRTPVTQPDRFRTVSTKAGALYGYALCKPCSDADPEKVMRLVEAVSDRAIGVEG